MKEQLSEKNAFARWCSSERENLRTLKQLKGTAKIEYVWMYYKLHLLAIIAAIVVICTVVTIVGNAMQPRRLQVGLALTEDTGYGAWFEAAADAINQDGGKGIIEVTDGISFAPDNPYGQYDEVKVMTFISAGTMDVCIGNAELRDYVVGNLGAALPMTEVLTAEQQQALSQFTVEGVSPVSGDSSETVSGWYTLSLDGTDFDTKFNTSGESLYLCVIGNTKRTAEAQRLIEYLYGLSV